MDNRPSLGANERPTWMARRSGYSLADGLNSGKLRLEQTASKQIESYLAPKTGTGGMDLRKRILVVDDDSDEELLILEAFRQNRLLDLVTTVRGGAEALDYLFCTGLHMDRSPADMPDLILLDLRMPGVSGIEVLDRIRADPRARLIPVVVFSGSELRRDLVAAYLGGANSFVAKPPDFAEYADVLRQVWHYWSRVNRALPSTEEALAHR